MLETIEVELGEIKYSVDLDITEETDDCFDDDDDDVYPVYTIDILDIYMIKKEGTYKVSSDKIWQEIEQLDLLKIYKQQSDDEYENY